ncbi:MAG: acetyl-CoA acetyltransferase [Modestobacter sp.]|nr:acetyl-CoA acetyltransferase [Modestobacter sp.]
MDPLPDLTGRVAPIAGGGTTTLDRAPIAGRRARFPHRAAHRPELRQAAVAVCETVSQAALRELAEEVGAADEVTSIHSVPLADLDVEPRLTAIPQSDAPVISLPLLGGSAALLVTTSERARELGLTPIVRVHTTVVAADDPVVMLTAPVPAPAGCSSAPASRWPTSACSRSTRPSRPRRSRSTR